MYFRKGHRVSRKGWAECVERVATRVPGVQSYRCAGDGFKGELGREAILNDFAAARGGMVGKKD
jgi:hypothetical protein